MAEEARALVERGMGAERMVVVDSRTGSAGHGFMAVAAANAAERGRKIYGNDPVIVSEIGPVIGTHTGPGLLGCAGLRSSLLGPV